MIITLGDASVCSVAIVSIVALLRLSSVVTRLNAWMDEHEKRHTALDKRMDRIDDHLENTDNTLLQIMPAHGRK